MSREAFEEWIKENPNDVFPWKAWQAGTKYITSRPTTNTRLDKDEFKKDDPQTLVDRLRGLYPVPVPGGYRTAPVQHEAARRIEELEAELRELEADFKETNNG